MLTLITLICLMGCALASPLSPQAANAGAQSQPASSAGKPASEGSTTFDGVSLNSIQQKQSTAQVQAGAIDRTGWTCTADSQQLGNPNNPCTNAIDGSNDTFWHTQWTPTNAPLPHQIIIDMQKSYLVGSITYNPRQDGSPNGNIGQHVISLSTNNKTFNVVAYGTYIDDQTLKMTTFTPTNGRYLKIQALTEAGNRGPWTSAADIHAYSVATGPPSPGGKGSWGPTIDFPLVPVSMANMPNGEILAWSSYNPSTFGGSSGTQTITATYNPNGNSVTGNLVTNTDHDMFCIGLSLDFNGRAIATGGNTASATSIFDGTSAWSPASPMQIARGYQAQVTVSSGNVFTIGASWSGGQGGKNGELFTNSAGSWGLLSGAPVAPMLTNDAQGVYRADNHGWLFAWSNSSVFQAGPSSAMNWYGTTGNGSQSGAGTRASDPDSMCGNAAMYDAVGGKILTVGGSPSYQYSSATSNAHLITLTNYNSTPTVQTLGNMAYARSFANSVILPDGTVLIVGGQSYAVPFSDDTSQFTPEIFNPATSTFTQVAPMAIPRNYHSTALLQIDGTVIVGGGGLCGDCATNHFDAQIFRPPYLYTSSGGTASRPAINSVSSSSIVVGGTFTATTSVAITSWSLIRMSSTTHTVNTDQRRIALKPTKTSGRTYTFVLPTDPGVAVPGYWMLFAVNSAGVPSTAQVVKVTASTTTS